MTYRLAISPGALAEIDSFYLHLKTEFPHMADEWFYDLEEAIGSLSEMPERCGRPFESVVFDADLRQLLYGDAPHQYRILFTIEGGDVRIHHVRYVRQRPLSE